MKLQTIKSSSRPGVTYEISRDSYSGEVWCSCPAWKFSPDYHKECKHTKAYLVLNPARPPSPPPSKRRKVYLVWDDQRLDGTFLDKNEAAKRVTRLNNGKYHWEQRSYLETRNLS